MAAALAIAVAMTAVAIMAGRLRRRTLAQRLLTAELDATRAGATAAIVSVDTGGAIVDWSPGAAALYGYEAEDVVAQDVSLLWAGEGDADAEPLACSTRCAVVTRSAAEEAVHRGKDGAEISVSLTAVPIRGASGETAGAVLTATDVSESARTRALIDEVEAKYRSLTERLPVVPYVHELGNRGATLYIGPQVNEPLPVLAGRVGWLSRTSSHSSSTPTIANEWPRRPLQSIRMDSPSVPSTGCYRVTAGLSGCATRR